MTRPLTEPEKTRMRELFPNMNVNGVEVSAEADSTYNCLAWTLGIANRWVWPWPMGPVPKAQFDALYQSYGFTPTSGSGAIAAFGNSSTDMTHGCITGSGHGPRWESKLGQWLRIQHGLGEMEGGTYGSARGFYSQTDFRQPTLSEAADRLIRLRKAQEMNRSESINAAEIGMVQSIAAKVDGHLRVEFEKRYAAWKTACGHPLIAVSSNPAARAQCVEFLELVALGQKVLPLLYEKLIDPTEFFALVAVDRLARPELIVQTEVGDENVLLGEQGRAAETIRRWLQFMA